MMIFPDWHIRKLVLLTGTLLFGNLTPGSSGLASAQAVNRINTVAVKPADLYVSVTGNDKNPGTRTAPFKSITAARDHIRKLKSAGKFPSGGITVWITGGDYQLSDGLEFNGQDSGTAAAPVIYSAVKGAEVNLIAATIVDPRLWKPLSSAAAKRVHPHAAVSNIAELDISALGLRNASVFSPENRFSDQWYIIDFFAANKRQPIAQWPNPGENIRNINDPGWITCNGAKDNYTFYYADGGKPEDKDGTNELDLDGTNRSSRWVNSLKDGYDLWLKGFWRVPWEPFTMKVRNIDTGEHTIRFEEEPLGGMGSKYSAIVSNDPLWRTGLGKEKWKAINLLEEIDYPGEWALDIKDKKIYFYAPSDISRLDIRIADTDHPVLLLNQTSYLTFTGLNISGSRSNGVEISGGTGNEVTGCTVSNVGDNGIIVKNSSKVNIRSNDIYETGGAGIIVADAGDRKTLTASGITLSNNHIHHTGKLKSRESIQLSNSVAVRVDHNLMHDLPKSAVRTDMVNDCIFEYNEVHNIALSESDNGAFYNYGGWSTYGNVFRYNFVHHVNRSNGFYCDDGDSGDLFYNNIVYDAIDAIKFGGGHNNIAKNNLFVRCKDQGIDDRGIARNYRLGTDYEKRLRDMNTEAEPWKSYGVRLKKEYGLSANLWADIFRADWHPEFPNGSAMVNNISVHCGPYLKPEHGDVTITGNLELPDLEDAVFYNLRSLDLRSRNAAILKKFSNLNVIFPLIGLRRDQFRITLPSRQDTGGLQNRGKAGSAWDEDQLVK